MSKITRGALLTVGLLVVLTFAPAAANANGYDVHACASSQASSANNSFVAQADAGMTAYVDCPAGQGMVVRNVFDSGLSSAGAAAYLVFDAPPGVTIGSMDFDAGAERHDCNYSASIVAGGHDFGGRTVWGLQAGQVCDSSQSPGPLSFFPVRWSFPINADRVRAQVRCAGGSPCDRDGVTAVRLRDVVMHMVDNGSPALSGGRGRLWLDAGWLAGSQTIGFDASDGSGIRQMRVTLDGREIASRNGVCDFTRPSPCPATPTLEQELVTAGIAADGQHELTLLATDAAGNESRATKTVLIDNTPPDAPRGVTVEGGDGWRKTNDFTVRWTNPPAAGAPVAGAEWELCRAGSSDNCRRGSKDGADLTAVGGIAVPGPGSWQLRVWLRDAAGNKDAGLAAPPVTLRWDETSPDVSLNPLSADDPTRVVAPVADQGAGVAGGEIAVRKSGTEKWIPMPTTLDGNALVGRIDDVRLGDGLYDLMARVTDAAGNERSATTFANGQPAQVQLPLRLKTKLVAGVVRGAGRRMRLLRTAYANYGRLVQVRGRLVTPEGNPMQDVEIKAYSQVRDGVTPPRLIATVRTSKKGTYSFLVRRGPSRTVRVVYEGAGQIRSAVRRVVVFVRSATTIRPNRRRLVNGEVLRFSGRVVTGRIPVKGKLVELEVLNRGRWRTFATTRASRRGAWKFDYRFDGTRGLQTYRFRAKIPRETGYPFAAGGSKVIRVQVRGL